MKIFKIAMLTLIFLIGCALVLGGLAILIFKVCTSR